MHQKGVTLVELMVVVVVVSIIGIAVLNLFVISNRTFMDQNKIIDVQRDGRLVVDSITRALREAGLNPLNSPVFQRGIKNIAASNVVVIARDLDLDGAFDEGEIVSYIVNFGILKRHFLDESNNILRSQDIAKNITSFQLAWFDEDGNSSPPLDDIRTVEVRIGFTDDKYIGDDFTRFYSTRVDLRNP